MKPLIASIIGSLLLAGLGFWFKENLKELIKEWGWTTFFVRLWPKWRRKFCWQRLRGLWWLWLSGGIVLALCVTLLLVGPPTFGIPLPNPLHDDAAKWRVIRNLYDLSLNRIARGFPNCDLIIVRYQASYAEEYDHDLKEILTTAGWAIHPSVFASGELPRGLSIKGLQGEHPRTCAEALWRSLLDDVEPKASGRRLNIKALLTWVPNEMVNEFVKKCSDTCVEVDIGNDPKP